MWRRPPAGLRTPRFVLEPLEARHNLADHRAWMSSIDHIRATPGFRPELWGGDEWPYPMTPEANEADLAQHAAEFAAGEAFAYTVLDPTDGDVIGCVYVDPDDEADARCRCWVRADRAALDDELAATLRSWLASPEWGFSSVRFPGRDPIRPRRSQMPRSCGFNHVATLSTDLDRTVEFYREVFGAEVTFELARQADHPRMIIVDIGGGAELNIFEADAADVVGDRRRQGRRGAIDHFGLAVADLDALRDVKERLVAAGADIGEIQRLGSSWSLFFRDPDGMELEVCCRADGPAA